MLDDSINVERRRELGRFLRNRRARLRPADVGLAIGFGHRRVGGLRREEVAVRAGVGIAWYTMLERGTADGVSFETLAAIARALVLSDDETAFVHTLIDPSIDDAMSESPVAPVALGAFASIEWAPAYICTARWNVLAWNRAMTLVWDIEPPGGPPFNIVRRMFTDDRVRALHGDGFGEFARRLVAMVRVGAGRLVGDPVYRGLEADLRSDPTSPQRGTATTSLDRLLRHSHRSSHLPSANSFTKRSRSRYQITTINRSSYKSPMNRVPSACVQRSHENDGNLRRVS